MIYGARLNAVKAPRPWKSRGLCIRLTVNLMGGALDRHVLHHHHHAKFCVDISYYCRDIEIFHIF